MPVIIYKCPNCGGEVTYNPNTRGFDCPYCNSDFSEDDVNRIWKKNESLDLSKNVNDSYNMEEYEKLKEFNQHTKLYSCSTCGAEIISDDTTSATSCVYCHNPVILSGRLSGDYKPDKLIPFCMDKDGAQDVFRQWVKKRWFVPKDFRNSEADISGIYVPYWLADCDTESTMTAHCENVRSWTEGNYVITETKEYDVKRAGNLKFLDIPADGANKIDDDLLGAIEPYDYKGFKPFSMSYLSGFLSNKFDVGESEVTPRINERVHAASDKYLRSTIGGYSSVRVLDSSCNILTTFFEYALLPVWFLNHKYNDVDYQLVVNGQTGKIAGTPPLDRKKLKWASILVAILIMVACNIIDKLPGAGLFSFLGFFVAIVAALLFYFFTKKRYEFKRQISAVDYLQNPNLTVQKDTFLREHRTRSRIKDND